MSLYFNVALSKFSALAGITSSLGYALRRPSTKALASPTTTMLAPLGSRTFFAAACTAAGSTRWIDGM